MPRETTPTGGGGPPPSASSSGDTTMPSGSTPTTRVLPPSTASPGDSGTSPKRSSSPAGRLLPASKAPSRDLKKPSETGSTSTRGPSQLADFFSGGMDIYTEHESSATAASRNGLGSLSIEDEEKIPLLSVDAADLHRRAMDFLEPSAHTVLAAPAVGLAKAIWVFASSDSKAKPVRELKAAASVLAVASANEKLAENVAETAKRLAFDATRLVFQEQAGKDGSVSLIRLLFCCCPSALRCWSWCCNDDKLPLRRSDVDRQKLLVDKRSALYCLSASLALLPSLPATLPKDQHVLMAYMYGIIFSTASVGLVLSLHAINRFELELARVLSRLSFVGLSVLVVMYLVYALSPGNLGVLAICLGILAIGHGYAWIRSCCTRVDDPSFLPEQAQSAQYSE